MKVAVAGKGGTGKTTVAAVLARSLATAGANVIAIDADPNPNLGIALGLGHRRTTELDSAVNAFLRKKSMETLGGDLDRSLPEASEELVPEVQELAPGGVRLVQAGRIERPAQGCLCCGSHLAGRRIFHSLSDDNMVLIADLEPGVNDLIWIEPRATDMVMIVTEPYRKSLEVAHRAVRVARELGVGRIVIVANRLCGPSDAAVIRSAFPGMELLEVPEDQAVARAAALGRSPVDLDPGSPAVRAIAVAASKILALAPTSA